MQRTSSPSISGLAGLLLASLAAAQVPDGHLVVSSFSFAGAGGSGGVYTADVTAPTVWTPVTGLPPALATAANCIVRDPATENLIVGNLASQSGGTADVFVLGLVGHTATVLHSINLGAGGGVHAVALLPLGEVLLALGNIAAGPAAGQQLVRWLPATGTLTPIVLPASYAAGNWANAVVNDGVRALVGLYNGFSQLWEVIDVPIAGGAVSTVWVGLNGEFPTQLAIDCHDVLHVATSREPFATNTGRIVTFARSASGWLPTGSVSGGGKHFNALLVDPATCRMFTSAQGPGAFGLDEVAGGIVLPLSAGPGGVVSGLDVNANPEVFEQPSGASLPARWSYRPYAGGAPTLGNLQFTLPLVVSPNSLAAAFLDTARGPGSVVTGLGLMSFLTPAAVNLGTVFVPPGLPGGPAVWTVPIPNTPGLAGLALFAQAAVLAGSGLGASDLLQFTIR